MARGIGINHELRPGRPGDSASARRVIAQAERYQWPYLQHQLARIYILVGEPERALDLLEGLMRIPYFLSPGWLRVDPTLDPLRGNPRFRRLVDGSS